jgi:chemosensory pili system protein ChpA (sensor histidine kinase/response regulator)
MASRGADMLKNTVVDRKMLAWIKQGVDETLSSVQDSLDDYIANPEDVTPIHACISPLHRVKGAVQMVGIEGATMLAAEMEQLACALAGEKVKQKQEAAEVLATGLFQLPGYLESLYHGHPDLPLVLLPMLNDFRASQDIELFTEGDFFSPNLAVSVPVQPQGEIMVSGDVITVAKKLRPGYLAGLLGLIKEDNVSVNLERLSLVLNNLLAASTSEKSEQLWWVAQGVVESLRDQGLEASIALKILLGRVDREIHRLIKHGETILNDAPPDRIIKNLLFYITQSQSSSDKVIEIKKAFSLGNTDNDAIDYARESLYGFNSNLIESITAQLNDELETIKCALDVVMHGNAGSTENMQPFMKNFSAVADALGMLGMSRQRDLINEQKEFLALKHGQNEVLSEEDLMRVATAILYAESSLNDLGSSMRQSNSDSDISPAEYEASIRLVAQEILEIIRDIKDHINHYSQEPSNILLICEVPELMRKIGGVMLAIGDDQQSNLCRAICHFFDQEIIINKNEVSEANLDLLADAITGLENFYQSVIEESVAPDLGLQVASQSMTQLGYPPEEDIQSLTMDNFLAQPEDNNQAFKQTGTDNFPIQ